MPTVQHPLDDHMVSVTIPATLSHRAAKVLILQEIDAIPMIAMSIRVLKYWGLIYENNWKRYFSLSLTTIFNASQFVYMFNNDADVVEIIRNGYTLVLWFITILRGWLIFFQRNKYEKFLLEFIDLYKELLNSGDTYLTGLLNDTNKLGKNAAIVNMTLGQLIVCGFFVYPIFADERILPYGSHVPGIDESLSPLYELFYIYQVIITPIGCCLYMPFGSLVVSFIMFAILMCKVLQHRLRGMSNDNAEVIAEKLTWCIKYQKTLIRYVTILNNLTTYVFLVEFMAFGALLCGLLFLVNIAETAAHITIAVTQISMIFSQILTLYWFANELSDATIMVAEAAYDTEWFSYPKPLQKNILLLIMRAQIPCSMTVGNVYPMSLEMFQSLINASYSYFTILRRFYG